MIMTKIIMITLIRQRITMRRIEVTIALTIKITVLITIAATIKIIIIITITIKQ